MQAIERPYVLPAEVIPGVPWPLGFRDEINKWSVEFFGSVQDDPAPPKPIKVARTLTQRPKDEDTFPDLLDHIADTFESISIPPIKSSWLSKHDISALHALGIHAPHPWLFDMRLTRVDVKTLPSMASVHVCSKRHDTEDSIHPRFSFAVKERTLPPSVEQIKGTPYRFGVCFVTKEKNTDPVMGSLWVWCWMVVDANGHIHCPSELRQQTNTIRHKRIVNGTRHASWVTRQWAKPALVKGYETAGCADAEHFMAAMFGNLLTWWIGRADCWSVAVKKDGKRVTFNIPQDQTSSYFADRDKTVKAVDGTSKKILHYVRPHTRANGAVVKAHVRGLREFSWLDYSCTVTAPKLTGRVMSASFDLVGEEALPDTPGMLDSLQVARLLAAEEDADRRKIFKKLNQQKGKS